MIIYSAIYGHRPLYVYNELVTTYKKSLKPVNKCTEVYDEVALTELFA